MLTAEAGHGPDMEPSLRLRSEREPQSGRQRHIVVFLSQAGLTVAAIAEIQVPGQDSLQLASPVQNRIHAVAAVIIQVRKKVCRMGWRR